MPKYKMAAAFRGWLHEPFALRKDALEFIGRIRERFDVPAVFIIAANVILFGYVHFTHRLHLRPPADVLKRQEFPIFQNLEWIVWGIDAMSVMLFLLSIFVATFLIRDETRFWVYAFSKKHIAQLKHWFEGHHTAFERLNVVTAFSDKHNIIKISDINYRAYRHSAFGMMPDKIRIRNEELCQKNPLSFMLFFDGLDPDPARPMGYLCLLPLNGQGKEMYLKGDYRDADIRGSLIAAKSEDPAAILLFATVLDPDFSLARGGLAGGYGGYIARCL